MSRPDTGTHTERDAGLYERNHAPEPTRLERAEEMGYDPYQNWGDDE